MSSTSSALSGWNPLKNHSRAARSFSSRRRSYSLRMRSALSYLVVTGVATELGEWFNLVDAAYRSDLRELNEFNFGRFDARLEQRVAELRAEVRAGFARAEAELDRRIGVLRAEMQAGFETGDAKLDRRLATTPGLGFGVGKLLGG